jgi:uncharacterized protein YkwD
MTLLSGSLLAGLLSALTSSMLWINRMPIPPTTTISPPPSTTLATNYHICEELSCSSQDAGLLFTLAKNKQQVKATPTTTPTKVPTNPPTPIVADKINPETIETKVEAEPAPKIQPTEATKPTSGAENGNEFTQAVNAYRNERGFSQLNTHQELCEIASKRAAEAEANFSHDGFEAAVSSLKYSAIAENLWMGIPFSTATMISSWDGSEGHRKNLEGDYHYGCGARAGNTVAFLFMR